MSANNQPVDRVALHRFLWDRSNRFHRIRLVQGRLAEDLGVTVYTVNRIIKELCQDGRLKVAATEGHRVNTYEVCDPALFAGGVAPPPPAPRRLQWG